jgi:hypothetical protein
MWLPLGEFTGHKYLGRGSFKYPDQPISLGSRGFDAFQLPAHFYKLIHTKDGCGDSLINPTIILQFFNGKLQRTSTATLF